jgi:hypothetical protein
MPEGPNRTRTLPVIDWLRDGRERVRLEDDLQLLRRVALNPAASLNLSLVLDEALFESTTGLDSLPVDAYDETRIDSALGITQATESITGWDLPLAAKGNSLREQIESLLPANLPNRSSIVYALCRIVADDTPLKAGRQLFISGLDPTAAALFAIHGVARAIGKKIAWLEVLWRTSVQQFKVNILRALLSDLYPAPTARSMRERLHEARDRVVAVVPQDPLGTSVIDGWLAMIPDEMAGELPTEVIHKLRNGETKGKEKRSGISEELDLLRFPAAVWPVLALRPDGALAADSEPILSELRQELNALDHKPIRDLCAYLADNQTPGSPTAGDLKNATGLIGTTSYSALPFLEMLITERYIPYVGHMGLQYRYLIMPQRKGMSQSHAVAEKSILAGEKESGETEPGGHKGLRIAVADLEPVNSRGPDEQELPEGSFNLVVGSELVSMRLDLYDVSKSVWSEPWNERRPGPRSSIQHLIRGEPPLVESPMIPMRREIDAMSMLWSFRGTRRTRQWLFESMGFPAGTAEHVVPKLFRKRLLGLLYHPNLEYCRLPEGLFACSSSMSTRELLSLIKWITGVFPYCRILVDRSGGSMVAMVRLPRLRSASAFGVLKERLRGIGCEFMVGTFRSYRSYFMTVLNRLYDPVSRNWADPWA